MKQNVLIIDDSKTVHAFVKTHLRDERVEVYSAFDGESGIRLATTLRPDVILLDVEMPGADGFDVCRRLKADPTTMVIPVIFLSGTSTPEVKIEGLNLGAADYVTKPFDPAELRARVRSALRNKYLLDLVSQRALVDDLTGLWNRAHFDQRLRAELAHSRRSGKSLACMMIDLDHFKALNDRHGHACGDEALRTVSQVLLNESGPSDVACRIGGEEFAVLSPGTTATAAGIVAERLREAVMMSGFDWEGATVSFTCSIGLCDTTVGDPHVVMRADQALYRAKRDGRNRVAIDAGPAAAPAPADVAVPA